MNDTHPASSRVSALPVEVARETAAAVLGTRPEDLTDDAGHPMVSLHIMRLGGGWGRPLAPTGRRHGEHDREERSQ